MMKGEIHSMTSIALMRLTAPVARHRFWGRSEIFIIFGQINLAHSLHAAVQSFSENHHRQNRILSHDILQLILLFASCNDRWSGRPEGTSATCGGEDPMNRMPTKNMEKAKSRRSFETAWFFLCTNYQLS
jgi:hypothetical protein